MRQISKDFAIIGYLPVVNFCVSAASDIIIQINIREKGVEEEKKKEKNGVEDYRGLKCGEEEAHFTTRVMGIRSEN